MKSTIMIALKDLVPFKGHPYKVEDNADMEALTESIRENGILNPLIVRPAENDPCRYEIISGRGSNTGKPPTVPGPVCEDKVSKRTVIHLLRRKK